MGNYQQTIGADGTPATITNPNVETVIASFALPAGIMNTPSRGLFLALSGATSLAAAQTPTLTLRVRLGGLAGTLLATFVTGAYVATATDAPWLLELYALTATQAATATVEARGRLAARITAVVGAANTYLDVNAAPTAAIDMSGPLSLVVTAQLSTSNAGNAVKRRLLVVQSIN